MEQVKREIPPPKLGSVFIYCPYVKAETVKVPKKRAKIVTTPCTFKTRKHRKYRRHWIRNHFTEDITT